VPGANHRREELVKDMAMNVFVVHTAALRDRRAALTPALNRLGWRATWIERPDPPDRGLRGFLRQRPTPRLNRAQVSVYRKHATVLRRVAAQDGVALVLEDDAVWSSDFADRFERYVRAAPPDFDIVFFGASCGLNAPPLAGNPSFALEPATRSLSGYLIRPACARLVAAELERRRIRGPIDHTINEIIRARFLRVYWSVPPLIENGSETGRFARSIVDGQWRSRPSISYVASVLRRTAAAFRRAPLRRSVGRG
jgi:hypothetical protein